jgi:tripartite-type tricarboxylate transporter receptor subunit TctC
MTLLRLLALVLLAPYFATFATAQDWPTRNIRLVVPFPAGGSADVQARVIADELSKAVGQPVIVDNKPGAGGSIGAADAAKAAPDGYTLFMATTGTHSSNISLYPKLPYDPEKDFAPLTLVTIYPQVVVPGEKYPQRSLPELIEALKKAGGDANYGSSGVGSPTHLGGELFKRQTSTQMVHVPYRGQVPALNDILGGRLDVMFPSIPDVLSFIQAGQLRALATMAETRSKALPDVPTMGELGHPELVSAIWSGLYTRAGTPQPIIDRLNRELVRIIASPVFKDKFEAIGFEVRPTTPAEFGAFAAAETRRWGEIIRALNIRLE